MWRTPVLLELVEWLGNANSSRTEASKTGFYGLDLYSLFNSMAVVVNYLDAVDPEAASRARYRYSSFEHLGEDSQAYGYAASFDFSRYCKDEAINQFRELKRLDMGILSKIGEGD